jgi:anti-anti-sigma factor
MTIFVAHDRPDGTGLLVVSGELDFANRGDLHASVCSLLRRFRQVTVDLMDVTFLDSSIVVCLVDARIDAVSAGGGLTLLDPSPAVTRLLAVMDVERYFEVTWSTANRALMAWSRPAYVQPRSHVTDPALRR